MYGAFFNNNSRRVIDSDLAGYTYSHKSNVSIAAGMNGTIHNTGVPTTDISPPLVFHRPEGDYAPIRLFESGGFWHVHFLSSTNTVINLVIFRRRFLDAPSGVGIVMRNSTGNITFNSSENTRAIWVRGYSDFSTSSSSIPSGLDHAGMAVLFFATRLGVVYADGLLFRIGFFTYRRLSGSLQYISVSLYADLDCTRIPTRPDGTNNSRIIPIIDVNDY